MQIKVYCTSTGTGTEWSKAVIDLIDWLITLKKPSNPPAEENAAHAPATVLSFIPNEHIKNMNMD